MWGEAGTVKIKTKTKPKLDDRGVQCVFVGYALEHSGNTYRMWDPKTGGIHLSRDVIWLRQMYYKPNEAQAAYVEVDDATIIEAEKRDPQEESSSNDSEPSDESSVASEEKSATSNDTNEDEPDRAQRHESR
jgi:hypothetical protein